MKLGISAKGTTLDDKMDMRFGRATGFIIYDTETKTYDYIDNAQNAQAAQGAGIQSAQKVVNENVSAVISGYCGPKAYSVLKSSNVKIYNAEEDSMKNIIEKFTNNELKEQED